MQVVVEWKYFDKRISLQDTLESLISEGYHICSVIPTVSWTKENTQNALITTALIIVTKYE